MSSRATTSHDDDKLRIWTLKLGEALRHPGGFILEPGGQGGYLLGSDSLYVHTEAGDAPDMAWVHAAFSRASHPVPRERQREIGIFYLEHVVTNDEGASETARDIRELLRYPL